MIIDHSKDPTEQRLEALGVSCSDIIQEDAYLRTVELLNRAENKISNQQVQIEGMLNKINCLETGLSAAHAIQDMYKAEGNWTNRTVREHAISSLAYLACKSAQEHGLYEPYDKIEDPLERWKALAARIAMECTEAMEATTIDKYAEELADIVILTCSVALHVGILNFGEEVENKRMINEHRPYKHGKDDGQL